MKKMFALLLAAMMLLAMVPAAMAYTAVTPANSSFTHTLYLTGEDMTALTYNIEYTFTVGDVEIMQPTDIKNVGSAVTGKPTLGVGTATDGMLIYTPDDTFTLKACQKTVTINWSSVSITEPGVYRWTVTKTVEDKDIDLNKNPTNKSETMYLYAYVIENGGALTVDHTGFTSTSTLNNAATKGPLSDDYPAASLDLTITKEVKGNQGSKDQYFSFTVHLQNPTGSPEKFYSITDENGDPLPSVPMTAYNSAIDNPTGVTVTTDADVTLWLKHGETAKINNLVFGTAYTVTEGANTGYSVESQITGDTNGTTSGKDVNAPGDTSIETSSQVKFINEKNATVPTGIELETTAPIVGMILAMAMLALMLIGKRKEEMA